VGANDGPGGEAQGRGPSWLGRGSAAAVAVAFVAVVVRALTWTFVPTGDRAVIGLHATEVGGPFGPLVGPYSRYGWSHPGPALYWAAAAGQHLWGHAGLMAAAAVVNGAALTAAVVVAGRRDRAVGLAAALVALVAVAADGATSFADGWNPYVVAVPLFAYLLAAWAAALGSGPALVLAVACGSWAVQAHVGSTPAVLGGAAVAVLARPRRDADGRCSRRSVFFAVAAAALLWSAPIWQQLTGRRGNLSAIVHFFASGHGSKVGASRAAGVLFRELAVAPPWAHVRSAVPASGLRPGAALGPVLLLVAVTVLAAWAHRRGHRARASLGWLALGTTAVSFVAIARVVDEPFEYVVHWTWAVSMLVWVALLTLGASAVADLLPAATRRWRAFAAPLAGAGLLALTVVAVVRAPDGTPPQEQAAAVRSLVHQLERHLGRSTSYRVRWDDPYGFAETSVGVAAQLMEDGWHLEVEPGLGLVFGRHRVAPGVPRPTVVLVSTFAAGGPVAPAGATVVAGFDPLADIRPMYGALLERVERDQAGGTRPLQSDLTVPLAEYVALLNGARPTDVETLADLQRRRGPALLVWVVPPLSPVARAR
jgi:hypothetical protein